MTAFRSRGRRGGAGLLAAAAAASWLAVQGPAAAASPDPGAARAGVDPPIARLAEERPDEPVVVWVRFTDRAGADGDPRAAHARRALISERALERRARRGAVSGLLASDVSVHEPYVRALAARGARLRGTSRWRNAASVEIAAGRVADLARLPFVAGIEPVARGGRVRPVEVVAEPAAVAAPPSASAALAPGDTSYYGGSFRQLDMMQAPALHALGLSGAGVLVCVLDTGFRLTHRAYAGLAVVATRDFIHGDANVDYDPVQDLPSQPNHGTWTLACIAGSLPGVYSGPAFAASVALAKTEDVGSETPVEMDYWQFAAEWADSLGADVISSSLGYTTFDDSSDSYTYADLDGRTTVVTRAAVEATRRGILVVNSAGNAGGSAWRYVVAPADADSMLGVGAVDSFNVVTSFSSRGPTFDGRVKPDVTAMGRRVLTVSHGDDSSYVRASGTSFSAPLVAGVAALLLEANPAWRPFEVWEALRETALNRAAPDNDIGWGLVQGLAARSWAPTTTGAPRARAGSRLALRAGPNPFPADAGTVLRFVAPGAGGVVVEVYDLAGRRRNRLFDGTAETPRAVGWDGRDAGGEALPAGVYWIRLAPRDAGRGGLARRVVLLP